jgi:hypothetical protein
MSLRRCQVLWRSSIFDFAPRCSCSSSPTSRCCRTS